MGHQDWGTLPSPQGKHQLHRTKVGPKGDGQWEVKALTVQGPTTLDWSLTVQGPATLDWSQLTCNDKWPKGEVPIHLVQSHPRGAPVMGVGQYCHFHLGQVGGATVGVQVPASHPHSLCSG